MNEWNLNGTAYPRPLLRRDSYRSLDGEWQFCTTEGQGGEPEYGEVIRVPFPPQAAASGIGRQMEPDAILHYRRTVVLDGDFLQARTYLHFGAVDQIAQVFVNGREVGEHAGGYLAFSLDVTDAIRPGENEICVTVRDSLDKDYPYGKQCEKPGGMWYTPVSGIWQSVWMESLPQDAILAIACETQGTQVTVRLERTLPEASEAVLRLHGKAYPMPGDQVTLEILTEDEVRLWSPEDPYLYEFTVETAQERVSSYFALRTVEIREIGGVARICLNGKPIFLHGLLDQGYNPDGIYQPTGEAEAVEDVRRAKELGFNLLRKHIKVEPERFYEACDRLGMLVLQDFVNNSPYSFFRDTALPTVGLKGLSDRFLRRSEKAKQIFREQAFGTMAQLGGHPCIIGWTVFNEGWGQFDADALYDEVKAADPGRLVDATSGWFRQKRSDLESEHCYFKPYRLKKRSDRPVFLSEFGGYSLAVPGHEWKPGKEYGYRRFTDPEAFRQALLKLYREEIVAQIGAGLCGAVYTQLTDVEEEINGLYTYDRAVCKVDGDEMRTLRAELDAAMRDACDAK